MTEPGAVVDVVSTETRPHQLLEKIGLLVRALGRAEACERIAAIRVTDALKPRGSAVESLRPACRAEMGEGVRGVDPDVVLRNPVFPDQRNRETLGVMDVVEAEAALDAEPILVAGPSRPSTYSMRWFLIL